ncbi:MAG: carboxymuconolactone decarboxylase family protein [Vicinamibacterales bacterium]
MTSIVPFDPAVAEGRTKALLDGVKAKVGAVPNLFRVLAHAPAALDAYLGLGTALSAGRFDATLRERIALAVAECNQCQYCLSAHSFIGGKLGLSEVALTDARAARADDVRTDAVLKLARAIVAERGVLRTSDIEHARGAGLDDADVIETVAVVVQNIFSNYVNHVAGTPVDFPAVSPGAGCAAAAGVPA